MEMDYNLFVGNNTSDTSPSNLILSGSLLSIGIITIGFLILAWFIVKSLRKKFREDENLKYEFVTIIAHKFRTPLTQVKWTLETVLENETDQFKKEPLQSLQGTNEKLIGLTNTLIELTESSNQSLSTYNFEKLNLCEVTNKMVENLKDIFHERNLFFGVQVSNPEIYAKIDKPRFEFVLQTIIENAVNYSPVGRNIQISVLTEKNKVYIQVTDEGIGIDKTELPKLFTKFFRSQSAQQMDTEGFGIGLYLAQSIVKRHQGKIEAFSEGLGKGSTFSIVLPLVK